MVGGGKDKVGRVLSVVWQKGRERGPSLLIWG